MNLKAERTGAVPLGRTFWLGVGVNLTNPKIVLFFVTFLPQFVDAADPHAAQKLVFLGLYFIAFSISSPFRSRSPCCSSWAPSG